MAKADGRQDHGGIEAQKLKGQVIRKVSCDSNAGKRVSLKPILGKKPSGFQITTTKGVREVVCADGKHSQATVGF